MLGFLTVGDFWKHDTKDAVKKSVVDKSGVMCVDLAEIQDEPRCEAGLGTMAEVMMVRGLKFCIREWLSIQGMQEWNGLQRK